MVLIVCMVRSQFHLCQNVAGCNVCISCDSDDSAYGMTIGEHGEVNAVVTIDHCLPAGLGNWSAGPREVGVSNKRISEANGSQYTEARAN